MNKKVENILKAAEMFRKLSQSVSFEAADIQVALGQSEGMRGQGGNAGYFAPDAINTVVNDIANKFNLGDDTKGVVTISCAPPGSVSIGVQLTDQKQLTGKVAAYLNAKFARDMAGKILAYCKKNNKQVGAATANWFNF